MPFQLSETTWWLLLGILVGFVIFWLIDKIFRRDGQYAAERERREVESLTSQLSELQAENVASQKKLTDRTSEVKRLTTLSEDLRDSVRGRDQKVTNLEAALAAAREQQVSVEPIRNELSTLRSEHQNLTRDLTEQKKDVERLGNEAQSARTSLNEEKQKVANLEAELAAAREQQVSVEPIRNELSTLRSEHQNLIRDLTKQKKDVERLSNEAQTARTSLNEKVDSIKSLEDKLRAAQDQLNAQAARHESALNKIRSEMQQSPGNESNPGTSGIGAISSAALAAASGAAISRIADPKPDDQREGNKVPRKVKAGQDPAVSKAADSSSPAKADDIAVESAHDSNQDAEKPAPMPGDQTGSTLASRHGGTTSTPTDNSQTEDNKPGLLDRLRGALSGRRPDDLD